MRIGQNPAKFVDTVPQPARVTVVIITYIPFLSGYYEQSLEVLKVCLNSIYEHTQHEYDLFIFDNASCPEVRAYLNEEHTAGRIQYLTLSEQNLGKAAAWNFVFAATPGEIVAYADADIYFEPGWLTALVNVLDEFPNAGMVTGIPMWSPEAFSSATVQWAEFSQEITFERGKLLPWEDYWKHAQSLGQDEPEGRKNFEQQEDRAFTHRGTRYYIGAGHFQFVARKSVLLDIIPIPADKPMGQVRRLDVAINERGLIRISTPDWWVRHLGNTLAGFEGLAVAGAPRARQSVKKRPWWLRGPLRNLAHWIYHKTFDLLYKR